MYDLFLFSHEPLMWCCRCNILNLATSLLLLCSLGKYHHECTPALQPLPVWGTWHIQITKENNAVCGCFYQRTDTGAIHRVHKFNIHLSKEYCNIFAFFSWNDLVKSTNAFQGSYLPWGRGCESLCHVKYIRLPENGHISTWSPYQPAPAPWPCRGR